MPVSRPHPPSAGKSLRYRVEIAAGKVIDKRFHKLFPPIHGKNGVLYQRRTESVLLEILDPVVVVDVEKLGLSVFSDPEEKMNLDNSISRLRQYFLETLQCLDVDLETSPTVEVKDVCAMFGLTPFCATDSIACKIEQFITLCAELKLCRVLVLIQAKAYMDDLSLESVYRNALRHRIGLIMVESAHRQEKLYAEKKIIVDKDFSDQIL